MVLGAAHGDWRLASDDAPPNAGVLGVPKLDWPNAGFCAGALGVAPKVPNADVDVGACAGEPDGVPKAANGEVELGACWTGLDG